MSEAPWYCIIPLVHGRTASKSLRSAHSSMRFFYGFAGVLLALGFVLYPILALSFSSGAPATASGSPVSMATGIGACTACHNTYELNEGTGSVTIDAPATFMPGETITFTVTVDNTTPPATAPKQGFEVSVEDDAAVAHVGTLVIADAANTRFATDAAQYVTHTSAGNQQTSWTVSWTAPDDAPETVTIYAAGNAANGDFGTTNDYIYTTSVTLERSTVANEGQATPLAARIDAIYPNPFVESARVAYTLEQAGPVTVTLYDGVGRVVRVLEAGARGAGDHTARVDAAGLAAGVYFVEVRTPEARMSRPLTIGR